MSDGKCWEVATRDAQYLQLMGQWAQDKRLVAVVRWLKDDEPVISYEPLPMPTLSVPHNMLIEPYEYQKEGIAYALEKKRCIMGDEMGLGKTAQAIGTMTASGAFPALVICPASLKLNWQREFKKFGGVNAIILDDSNRNAWQNILRLKRPDGKPFAQVVIVNYESLKKFFVRRLNRQERFTLKSIEFDERIHLFRSVIIDESHKCKSNKTQQSKFVQGIAQGKEYILELTGTPVVNNNMDLIQQLNIMGRMEEFGGYTKFVGRYCAGMNKSSHLKELNYRLRQSCFFRRQKKDVLTQLPDKTRSYLVTDISNRREYNDAERDILKYLKDYTHADNEKILKALRGAIMVKMGILKQVSARGKIDSAVDIIHNTIDGGEKLIVFCFLKEVVAALKSEFPEAVTVTGDDNDKQKQRAVDMFQENAACKLIILNYRSGGTGLTLTAASNVLFVEFPWTYSDCCQAEDRAHRNGQKNAVTCTYLLGSGTIDEYMFNLIQTKKEISNGVTGTDDETHEKISQQQMVVNAAMDMFKGKY
jgi:SWI/SNF-related matrix-associated actin-dependent regulator 1 of chromatin subfamily A